MKPVKKWTIYKNLEAVGRIEFFVFEANYRGIAKGYTVAYYNDWHYVKDCAHAIEDLTDSTKFKAVGEINIDKLIIHFVLAAVKDKMNRATIKGALRKFGVAKNDGN